LAPSRKSQPGETLWGAPAAAALPGAAAASLASVHGAFDDVRLASQFESPPSAGKQKAVRNLGNDVKRTLEVPVRLNEQGKARRVSTQEAALLRLREMALKGDARSLDRLLALAQIFNNGAAIESLGDKTVAAEDQAILDAYAAEVLSRAVSASAMRLGATGDSGPNADG
jgi:hypothetical protein